MVFTCKYHIPAKQRECPEQTVALNYTRTVKSQWQVKQCPQNVELYQLYYVIIYYPPNKFSTRLPHTSTGRCMLILRCNRKPEITKNIGTTHGQINRIKSAESYAVCIAMTKKLMRNFKRSILL